MFNIKKLLNLYGITVIITSCLFFAVTLQAADMGSNINPVALSSDQTSIDFGKVTWEPLEVEGLPPGAEIALLRGDLGKDGSQAFVKAPPGYVVPSHTHTSDELYVWMGGAFTLVSHDGKKTEYRGPAYISFPGSAPPHALICGDKEEYYFYLAYSRPFDIKYPDK